MTKREIIDALTPLADDATVLVIKDDPSGDFDNVGFKIVNITIAAGDGTDDIGYAYIHASGIDPMTILVKCPTCDGTGRVHSHNPICWTCGGLGETRRDKAEVARRVVV